MIRCNKSHQMYKPRNYVFKMSNPLLNVCQVRPGSFLSSHVHILFVDIRKHRGVIQSIKAKKKKSRKKQTFVCTKALDVMESRMLNGQIQVKNYFLYFFFRQRAQTKARKKGITQNSYYALRQMLAAQCTHVSISFAFQLTETNNIQPTFRFICWAQNFSYRLAFEIFNIICILF